MKEVSQVHIGGRIAQRAMTHLTDTELTELEATAVRLAKLDPDDLARFMSKLASSMATGTAPARQKWSDLAAHLRTCLCGSDALAMCRVISNQANVHDDEAALRNEVNELRNSTTDLDGVQK